MMDYLYPPIRSDRLILIGDGILCKLLSINKTFYVFMRRPEGTFVKGYNQNFEFNGFEKCLTPLGKKDIDHAITFDGEYIYIFAMLSFDAGEIRKFDKKFNLIKIKNIKSGEDEIILDQSIAYIGDEIFVGTEYRENNALWKDPKRPIGTQNIAPNAEVNRSMYLRIFDKDLNLIEKKKLIASIEGAVPPNQYCGIGVSQLNVDGYYTLIVHASIGNYAYFVERDYRQGAPPDGLLTESAGARQVFVLIFDNKFNFLKSIGPLTDPKNDNSWCTGCLFEKDKYYISYQCRKPSEGSIVGPGIPEENSTFREAQGNIRLSIFDKKFKELTVFDVTNFNIKRGTIIDAANTPSLLKINEKLYVGFDHKKQAFVQELTLED